MSEIFSYLAASPVIPAVRRTGDVAAACASPGRLVYVLTGDISNIGGIVGSLVAAGKVACVNADLVEGLAGHPAAAAYLASVGASGVVSTHHAVLKGARAHRLLVIQRTFLLDSQSVANVRRSLERFVPDALEVLPAAVAPRTSGMLRDAAPGVAVIAGGLVATLAEIDELVRLGIDAVSVSNPALWVV